MSLRPVGAKREQLDGDEFRVRVGGEAEAGIGGSGSHHSHGCTGVHPRDRD